MGGNIQTDIKGTCESMCCLQLVQDRDWWWLMFSWTEYRKQTTDQEIIPAGGRGVWRGAGTVVGRSDSSTITHKEQAFRGACSKPAHCANAFRMGSSNWSLTPTSCACAAIAFLAGIISWSVESNNTSDSTTGRKFLDLFKNDSFTDMAMLNT
jgi:hypothetical protein